MKEQQIPTPEKTLRALFHSFQRHKEPIPFIERSNTIKKFPRGIYELASIVFPSWEKEIQKDAIAMAEALGLQSGFETTLFSFYLIRGFYNNKSSLIVQPYDYQVKTYRHLVLDSFCSYDKLLEGNTWWDGIEGVANIMAYWTSAKYPERLSERLDLAERYEQIVKNRKELHPQIPIDLFLYTAEPVNILTIDLRKRLNGGV